MGALTTIGEASSTLVSVYCLLGDDVVIVVAKLNVTIALLLNHIVIGS